MSPRRAPPRRIVVLATALITALASAFAAGGCGGEIAAPAGPTTSPVAGMLTVVLVTPHADDGALMLTIEGGPVADVASAPELAGAAVYMAMLDSIRTRVIVTGVLARGPLLALRVPDVARAGGYRLTLEQAASATTLQPQSLEGYRLTAVVR